MTRRLRCLAALCTALLADQAAAWQSVQALYRVPGPPAGCAGARGWGTYQGLLGTNDYTGFTAVSAGTLVMTPNLASNQVGISDQAMLCVTGWDHDIPAAVTTGSGDTAITWTASRAYPGAAGNALAVQIVASATAGTTATASVSGATVTVTRLASAQGITVAAAAAATGMVDALGSTGIPPAVGPVSLNGGVAGAGAVPISMVAADAVAATVTTWAGGNREISWSARAAGAAGNNITIAIVPDASSYCVDSGTAVTLHWGGEAGAGAAAACNATTAIVTATSTAPWGSPEDPLAPVALAGGADRIVGGWAPLTGTALLFANPDAPSVPLAVNGTVVAPSGGTVSVSLPAGGPRRGWPLHLIAGTLSGTWGAGSLPSGTTLYQDTRGLWLRPN